MREILTTTMTLPLLAVPLLAQGLAGGPGSRVELPEAREVALARSAAPGSVSQDARIWTFAQGTYRVAVDGTSSIECYVGRSWPKALEPQCFDAEGAATIMRMEMRRAERFHAGREKTEVDREIALGVANGTFKLPSRPAMSWMLSSGQVLFSDDGRPAGAWRPHVMIYFPYLTAAQMGIPTNSDVNAGIVVNSGTPFSSIMVVVPDFVDPAPPGIGRSGA